MSRANLLPPLAPEIEATLDENNVDDETRYMARKYFNEAWGKPSVHVEAPVVMTWAALMKHARGEEEGAARNSRVEEREGRNAARKARTAKTELGAEWLAWQEQCTQRNAWIEQANAEWRRRVALAKIEKARLDAFVEEARSELAVRKATAAPVQPKR